MITVQTDDQINQVNTDVHVRMRHHAPAVQRVADILIPCIFSNASLIVEDVDREGRYGYCYKITTPTNQRFYITYNHDDEVIFVKDKMRNYNVIHVFENDDTEIDIITAVRRIFV